MKAVRILTAALALTLAACATQSSQFTYKTTEDKSTILGRAGQELSIQSEGVTVHLRAPDGWKVVDALEEPLDWDFSANAPHDEREFGVVVRKDKAAVSTQGRYQAYLDNVHRYYDPKVCMNPEDPFTFKDGRSIVPYLYCSKYWGQRLVVMIPEGKAVTVFEFTAPTLDSLHGSRRLIQQMISSYSSQGKKG